MVNRYAYDETINKLLEISEHHEGLDFESSVQQIKQMYVKGEIEVDLLMCAYRKILLEIASDDIMLKSWYSEELVKKLGLD